MTIKYNTDPAGNIKIITKDGKVSCECCDVECCMYPAQAFEDGEYAFSDLPDEVFAPLNPSTGDFFDDFNEGDPQFCSNGIYAKQQGTAPDPPEGFPKPFETYYYIGPTWSFDPGDGIIRSAQNLIGLRPSGIDGAGDPFDAEWVVFYYWTAPAELAGQYNAAGFGGACLIGGLEGQQDWGCFVTDDFADSYTINGLISGTVTRESVCVWRGAGLTLLNYGYQWRVNGNNKIGDQNTPVGSYAGGYTVS
jgi:hypothetical protein